MDDFIYQNGVNHQGFIYQNPHYNKPEANSNRAVAHESKQAGLKLATIYVLPQVYKGINTPAEALKQGTAFKELYRPFIEKMGGIRS